MDQSKPWPVSNLFNEIIPAAWKFAAEVSTRKLHPKVVNWSKADSARMLILAVSASTTTTNTAAVVVSGSSFPPAARSARLPPQTRAKSETYTSGK